ncbi:MAG: hypothetical protein KC656_26705 [Myxococcales bacterium]|nr:hypothetical protein [Myxococcales bacterium]
MRLALVAAGLCALFGCSVCPSPLCTAWLGVSVTAQPWQEGAYTLTVDGVDRGRLLTCTFGVPYDGAVPTVADVECNDVVRKAGVIEDTYGTVVPDLLELRVPVGEGTDRPDRVQVRVTFDAGDGPVEVSAREEALGWTERAEPRFGNCPSDCGNARLVVEMGGT